MGLIGSDTKAKRFVTKLTQRGFDEHALSRLVTPIGDRDIPGKRPIEVAVSISAQLIAMLHSDKSELKGSPKSTNNSQSEASTPLPADGKIRENKVQTFTQCEKRGATSDIE